MEVAILNMQLTSRKFWKANKLPKFIAKRKDFFQNHLFSTEDSL